MPRMMLPAPTTIAISTPRAWTATISSAMESTLAGSTPWSEVAHQGLARELQENAVEARVPGRDRRLGGLGAHGPILGLRAGRCPRQLGIWKEGACGGNCFLHGSEPRRATLTRLLCDGETAEFEDFDSLARGPSPTCGSPPRIHA